MRCEYLLILLLVLFSCKNNEQSTLVITFTTSNGTRVKELAAFYLTKMDPSTGRERNYSFKHIQSDSLNKFTIEDVPKGLYKGMAGISNDNGGTSYLNMGEIELKPGKNYLIKEVNIGAVKLPDAP
jgi:hypothetical protein